MIQYSTIDDIVVARLDAEGSDHYDLIEDRIPAANSAQDRLAGMCVRALEANKFSAEVLRDLLQVRIWQASAYGRLNFIPAALGHSMMSVVAVMPDPEFFPGTNITPLSQPQPYQDRLRLDLPFYQGRHLAKRLTREQWINPDKNIFKKGNTEITDPERVTYSYLHIRDYRTTTYLAIDSELEIRPIPPGPGRYVAVEYLRYPSRIVQIASAVEFPVHMTDILASMTLSYLSVKQGDGTNLYRIAEDDIAKQVSLLGW